VFVTAIYADDAVTWDQGRVYGWFGPLSGTFAGSSADVIVTGDTMYGNLGTDVELGDFNGDAVDDLVIGNQYGDDYLGKAWVVSGPTSGVVELSAAAAIGGVDDGEYSTPYVGWAVGALGDWSGDGADEIIVAGYGTVYGGKNYYAGRTWVVSSDDL